MSFSPRYQRMGATAAKQERERQKILGQLAPANEAALRKIICDGLRQMGWMVRDVSQRRKVEGGLMDAPDIFAWKAGRTLLIETKSGKNKLREGQARFGAEIAPHCDPRTLIYCVAHSMDDVLSALGL